MSTSVIKAVLYFSKLPLHVIVYHTITSTRYCYIEHLKTAHPKKNILKKHKQKSSPAGCTKHA